VKYMYLSWTNSFLQVMALDWCLSLRLVCGIKNTIVFSQYCNLEKSHFFIAVLVSEQIDPFFLLQIHEVTNISFDQ